MAQSNRVLVVGWDSAPPKEVFEDWREDLPNLDRLMRQGSFGRLRSTDPPITVPAWSSMLSSKNPGQLGFYGFRNRKVGQYAGKWIATSQAVKVERVWDVLSRHGKRCCVFNVPQTFPVKPLNGILISSFLTPSNDSDYVYPKSLKPDIERAADGYMIDCENFRTDDKQWLLDQIHTMTRKRFQVARFLMTEQGPWDFFMMVYMGPDRIQHGFWKFNDPQHRKYEAGNPFENCLREYYKLLDEQLGELCELAGSDATVIVVSDHGAKRMEGSFNVNDWLMQEGFLRLEPDPSTSLRPGRSVGPTDKPDKSVGLTVRRFDEEDVDWAKTVAWAWGGYYSRIFLNVQGREPEGTIAPGEYESVRDDLIKRLEMIPDDKGRKMETRALRPQDLFSGPYVESAPDLLVYFDDLYWRAGQDIGHDTLYSFDTEIGPDDSVHDYDGIVVIARPGEQRGAQISGVHCMDVAPTVLDALGVSVPGDWEGKVIR